MSRRFALIGARALGGSFTLVTYLSGANGVIPMKRLLLSAIAVTTTAGLAPVAFAQDSDWTGLYVGGSAGYSFKSDDEAVVFDTDRDGVFDDTVRTTGGANAFSPGFCDGAAQGPTFNHGCRKSKGNINLSVRVGFDWQFGNWVVGAVGEHSLIKLGDDVSAFSTTPASYTFTRDLNALTSARLRGGWATETSLLYATGGVAWGDMDQSFTTTNTTNSFTPSEDSEVEGFQVGLGYELKLEPSWLTPAGTTIGLEYLWTSLDDGDYPVAVGPGTAAANNPFLLVNPTGTDMARTKDMFEFSTLGLTFNYRL
jgi:outer membrane immunogenic protein